MTINRAAAIAIILSSAISQVTQPPPVSEMPLFLSWYDPELCKPENGIVWIRAELSKSRIDALIRAAVLFGGGAFT